MYAITGAAGHLGRAATLHAHELLDDPTALVLITRTPDALSEHAGPSPVRRADFDDPASLQSAFAGVERLLLISTDSISGRERQHIAAIDAAIAAGVSHIVYTSMISPDASNPAVIAESHRLTEEHLRSSGIGWTILRCGLYSDFQVFEAAEALSSGMLVHNRGDGRCSYISRDDCAAAAAAALLSRSQDSATYEITGPAALNAVELAALYAEIGARPVESRAVDDQEFSRILSGDQGEDGHVQYGVSLVVSIGQATREGHFDRVTTHFRELTGKEPQTVADMIRSNSHMLPTV